MIVKMRTQSSTSLAIFNHWPSTVSPSCSSAIWNRLHYLAAAQRYEIDFIPQLSDISDEMNPIPHNVYHMCVCFYMCLYMCVWWEHFSLFYFPKCFWFPSQNPLRFKQIHQKRQKIANLCTYHALIARYHFFKFSPEFDFLPQMYRRLE